MWGGGSVTRRRELGRIQNTSAPAGPQKTSISFPPGPDYPTSGRCLCSLGLCGEGLGLKGHLFHCAAGKQGLWARVRDSRAANTFHKMMKI